MITGIYGKKYAHLRTRKWERGFGEGKGLDDIGLTPEIMTRLEKAIAAYWKDRLRCILEQVGKASDAQVLTLWDEAMDELYGEEILRKKTVYETVLQDESISSEVKKWLATNRSY